MVYTEVGIGKGDEMRDHTKKGGREMTTDEQIKNWKRRLLTTNPKTDWLFAPACSPGRFDVTDQNGKTYSNQTATDIEEWVDEIEQVAVARKEA